MSRTRLIANRIVQRRMRGASGFRGQALVLFIVFAAVLAIGVVLLFDTGQMVSRKTQLMHAADAAAYSVAVQQAKVLNLVAYLNRGRVANEVFIAQLISLWSWQNMAHTNVLIGHTIASVAKLIPVVGVVFVPLEIAYKAADVVMGISRYAIWGGATAGIFSMSTVVNTAYAGAAKLAIDLLGGPDAIYVANDVLTRNVPEASLHPLGVGVLGGQLAKGSGKFGGMLVWHDTKNNDGMARYRNVVMASRDKFSADRTANRKFGFKWGVWVEFRSRGGTDLIGTNRWTGLDLMQLHTGWAVPMAGNQPYGWGGAQAVSKGQPSFFEGIGNWSSFEHNKTYRFYGDAFRTTFPFRYWTTAKLANQYPATNTPFLLPPKVGPKQKQFAYIKGYQGLQGYHEVRENWAQRPWDQQTCPGTQQPCPAGPVFTVFAQLPETAINSSERIQGIGGPPGGQLELHGQLPNNRMTAVASAQTYFNRPPYESRLFRRALSRNWHQQPRADNRLERGSLFSPYWQARLVETPNSVYALLGIGSL